MTVALVMLFANMAQLSIGASSITAAESSTTVSKNLLNVFSAKMSSIQKENQTLSIKRILPVKDFSGADYFVIECNPTGYMILPSRLRRFCRIIAERAFSLYGTVRKQPILRRADRVLYRGRRHLLSHCHRRNHRQSCRCSENEFNICKHDRGVEPK